jgi:hypothetical protein
MHWKAPLAGPSSSVSAISTNRAARPKAGGVSVASSDDASVRTRFVGVSADGLVGFEVRVALDWKA